MTRWERLLLLGPYAVAHHRLLGQQNKRDVSNTQTSYYQIAMAAGFDAWDYVVFSGEWDWRNGESMPTEGVYALNDMDDTFYVGRSANIERRAWDHVMSTIPIISTPWVRNKPLEPMNDREVLVAQHIIRILRDDRPVECRILSCDQKTEDAWIMSKRAAGAMLYNLT